MKDKITLILAVAALLAVVSVHAGTIKQPDAEEMEIIENLDILESLELLRDIDTLDEYSSDTDPVKEGKRDE